MNHSFFEEWLLSQEDLTDEQKQALQEHLKTCPQCARLAAGWRQAANALEAAPLAAPQPGFTGRFQTTLAKKRLAQQRRLIWRVLLGTLAAALTVFLVIVWPNLSSLPTPVEILAQGLANITILLANVEDTGEVIANIFRGLPIAIPITVWIILAMNLLVWSTVWFLCIWKLPSLLRSRNEASR